MIWVGGKSVDITQSILWVSLMFYTEGDMFIHLLTVRNEQ